jgi:hypothetical protein
VSERAEAIAVELVEVTDEALELGEGLTEQQWALSCGPDIRSVGQVMHHVGDWLRMGVEWVNLGCVGDPIEVTPDVQDAINAREAAALPEPEKEETLLFVRELRDEAVARLRELGDEELDRRTLHVGMNRELSVEQLAGMAVRHTRRHIDDLRRILSGGALTA